MSEKVRDAVVKFNVRRKAERLAVRFPGIEGIKPAADWLGEPGSTAIHLGNAAEGGEIDGVSAADYYAEDPRERIYVFGVHRKLVDALEALGYSAEWYDGGTLLAWPS